MAEPAPRTSGARVPPLTPPQAARWKRQVGRARVAAGTARVQEPAARDLVRAALVVAGDTALDLGAGDGNVARAAARAGARTVACDLNEAVVRAGAARVRRASWAVADAERLPYRRGAFTKVLSNFAVVYAADPDAAVREVVRVLAPGGVFAFTAHTADSLHARTDELLARYDPPTLPYAFPLRWGDPALVTALLSPYCDGIATSRERLVRPYPSFAEMWTRQQAPGGLPAALKPRLSPAAHREFADEYRELLHAHRVGAAGPFALGHTYLRVVAHARRGNPLPTAMPGGPSSEPER
ncbi:class I SAM-dependent methyltransferase [Streptomyces sp. NRRL F-5123]|uniref:class I SAM-dependent methyltransferase n=1 Tax=Streptomyces sp. NRRL F-5123 TaxID=1463856 RepID=UPI0006940A8D|nr:class I SAM-dependent methyltransferase [Streptomyces sp. NRRL F-5123]